MDRSAPRRLDSLPGLVGFVREFLAQEGLPEELSFDMDLVIEELFTNLVRHARAEGDIRVRLSRGEGEVRIELVAPEPSPFDPTATPRANVNLPLDQRRPGGLGIHLVRELCQEFRYEWRDGVGTTLVVMGVNG